MNKYKLGQFAKARGEWFEILNVRHDITDGKVEYQLGNGSRKGWITEDSIEDTKENDIEWFIKQAEKVNRYEKALNEIALYEGDFYFNEMAVLAKEALKD